MNTNEYKPVSNYLALTVKRENHLTVKKAAKKIARMTIKVLLYLLVLTCANVLV